MIAYFHLTECIKAQRFQKHDEGETVTLVKSRVFNCHMIWEQNSETLTFDVAFTSTLVQLHDTYTIHNNTINYQLY